MPMGSGSARRSTWPPAVSERRAEADPSPPAAGAASGASGVARKRAILAVVGTRRGGRAVDGAAAVVTDRRGSAAGRVRRRRRMANVVAIGALFAVLSSNCGGGCVPAPAPDDGPAPRPVPPAQPESPPAAPPTAYPTTFTPAGHLATDVGCAASTSAPALDAFFRERIGPVLGFDYQHVYPLGGDRYLWLFQDTFIDHTGQ